MNLWDNKRLYDIALRSQLLVEGVKAGSNNQLNAILRQMMDEIVGVLGRTEYQNLSEISKKQLLALLRTLKEVQGRAFSRYTETAMETLRDFADAQASVQARVWAYSRFSLDAWENDMPEDEYIRGSMPIVEEDKSAWAFILAFGFASVYGLSTATDKDRLWSTVNNLPLQATGAYPLPSYQAFVAAYSNRIENEVRRNWATPERTSAELIDALSSLPAQGGSSVLATGLRQSAAVNATVMQHVAQTISEAVSSAMFRMYRWVSIIDSRTTDICRRLNLRVFVYGKGPVPPAHTHCRSHITPLNDDASMQDENLYTWLREQPRGILDYILGAGPAQKLLDGTLGEADLPALVFPPMTPAQYAAQVKTIIN